MDVVLTVTRQEIRNCWLAGMTLEKMLTLCPQSHPVKKFVSEEYMKLSGMIKVNPEDYIKRLQ